MAATCKVQKWAADMILKILHQPGLFTFNWLINVQSIWIFERKDYQPEGLVDNHLFMHKKVQFLCFLLLHAVV